MVNDNTFACLQLMQHASGSKLYLGVPKGLDATWMIGPTLEPRLDWTNNFIYSASAGGVCPADPSNAINARLGIKSWRYKENMGWNDCDIQVKCEL